MTATSLRMAICLAFVSTCVAIVSCSTPPTMETPSGEAWTETTLPKAVAYYEEGSDVLQGMSEGTLPAGTQVSLSKTLAPVYVHNQERLVLAELFDPAVLYDPPALDITEIQRDANTGDLVVKLQLDWGSAFGSAVSSGQERSDLIVVGTHEKEKGDIERFTVSVEIASAMGLGRSSTQASIREISVPISLGDKAQLNVMVYAMVWARPEPPTNQPYQLEFANKRYIGP